MRHYHQISEKDLDKFKEICEKEGIHYDTDEEYREAAQNLYSYVSLTLDLAMEENARKRRLESEPKGFAMPGEGRNCSLCQQSVYETDGWYDKWGFKCMNCQSAIDKKKIPGSLCGDWNNEKYVTESQFAWKTGLHSQTVRKMIRNSEIKTRQIPNGPRLILRKDNPNLSKVLAETQPTHADTWDSSSL